MAREGHVHSRPPPWSWNLEQTGPALGTEERARDGQRLWAPGGSLHLCVSSRLSSWRASGLCSSGPCKEAGEGRGWRRGWALTRVGYGRAPAGCPPLAGPRRPGNSGSLRQARTHEGLFALWWPTWESHPAVPRQVESDPRSPGGSPSRNPGSSRGQAGSPVSSAEASGPWLCDLRPSLGTPRVSAVPTNPSPTPCHPQSSLPPPLCPLQGWCAGGMTGWTHSEPGQSLRCKVGVGLCPLPPWPPP